MSFDWQGKRVLLKGENPPKLQYIELEHLNSLAGSQDQLEGYHLCNLQMVDEVKAGTTTESTTVTIPSTDNQDIHLQNLLAAYIDLFQEPTGLPPLRSHDHRIPLKEGGDSVNLRPYRYSGL
jgi:hypothetical protein